MQSVEDTQSLRFCKTVISATVDNKLGSRPFGNQVGWIEPTRVVNHLEPVQMLIHLPISCLAATGAPWRAAKVMVKLYGEMSAIRNQINRDDTYEVQFVRSKSVINGVEHLDQI